MGRAAAQVKRRRGAARWTREVELTGEEWLGSRQEMSSRSMAITSGKDDVAEAAAGYEAGRRK